jgi:hypothetical protein
MMAMTTRITASRRRTYSQPTARFGFEYDRGNFLASSIRGRLASQKPTYQWISANRFLMMPRCSRRPSDLCHCRERLTCAITRQDPNSAWFEKHVELAALLLQGGVRSDTLANVRNTWRRKMRTKAFFIGISTFGLLFLSRVETQNAPPAGTPAHLTSTNAAQLKIPVEGQASIATRAMRPVQAIQPPSIIRSKRSRSL